MKRLTLGIAIIGSFVLTACGGGSGPDDPKIPGGTGGGGSKALTSPIFSPGTGELPLPNDLLFSGTTDLTLNIPAADPTDDSDPAVALGKIDGWSTNAPFFINFRNNDGTALDASTIVPGSSIRIFKTSVARPVVNAATGTIAPTGPVTGIISELAPGTDFVAALASPLTVVVLPVTPFEAQASYMVVVTTDVADVNGNPVVPDGQYAIAKTTDPIPAGLPTSPLEPVRQLVNAMLAAAGEAGIAADDVALSYQFTVQSIGEVITAAKQFYIDLPFSMGAPPATSFSSLFTTTAPFTGLGAANLHKGNITIPYFLSAPSAANPTAILNQSWVAASMVPNPADPTMLVPNPLAGGNLTYANRLPEKTSDQMVPLMVSTPVDTASCPKPWSVMIFQHGITGNRTQMIGIADAMAAACIAVVSMDMPLHGITADNAIHLGLQVASGGTIGIFEGYDGSTVHERTFGVDFVDNATRAPGPDGLPDASGSHFINLPNLVVSRDNLREASVDLLALEKAIPAMDIDGDMVPDFNPGQVHFMGHSLGAMTGSNYIAYSDLAKTANLAIASGGIAKMINASESFGPIIRAGLEAEGVLPGTPDFESFLFVAQTVIDAGDPISHADVAVAANIPTLALQIKNDATIPNSVPGAPLAGSEPLARVLDLTTYTESVMDAAGLRAFVKYTMGNHGTPISPAGEAGPTEFLAVTTAIQTQIATFAASGGTTLVVDPDLVEP